MIFAAGTREWPERGFGRGEYNLNAQGKKLFLNMIEYMLGNLVREPQVKAWNPSPPHGTTGVTTPLLEWTAGDTAALHDVYFGTNPDLGPDEFMGRQPFTRYYHKPGLKPSTTCYWCVHEIEADGTTTHAGDVWSFTTAPSAGPAHEAVAPGFLHQAARDGSIEQVKSLISKAADVNANSDRFAGTPLHMAAHYARREVIQLLIAEGANVNARNNWDRTALHEAVDQGHTEIVELLRKHGAKIGTSTQAEKAKPTKSLLEGAAAKFDIPNENLEIPERMQSCAANLRKIYTAIKKYEKDKGKLPDWLSDLVPDYLSKETLLCPHDPVHKVRLRHLTDPRLPCSYGYQLSMARSPAHSPRDPVGGMTMRDWKMAEMKLFGDVVPLARCYVHGLILNLNVGGQIYLSPVSWSSMFMPNYSPSVLDLSEERSP